MEERFWSKVDKNGENGCWNWTAGCNSIGYGIFQLNGKQKLTHRISLELSLGRPIADNMCVLHSCIKNRKCVNPNHLREGTHKENTNDMMRDGTAINPKGEAHGQSKLKNDEVNEIIILRDFGFTQLEIAKMYCVNQSTIYRRLLVRPTTPRSMNSN